MFLQLLGGCHKYESCFYENWRFKVEVVVNSTFGVFMHINLIFLILQEFFDLVNFILKVLWILRVYLVPVLKFSLWGEVAVFVGSTFEIGDWPLRLILRLHQHPNDVFKLILVALLFNLQLPLGFDAFIFGIGWLNSHTERVYEVFLFLERFKRYFEVVHHEKRLFFRADSKSIGVFSFT